MVLLCESDTERRIVPCIRSADALRADHRGLPELRQEFGIAPSATTRSHREHTTLRSKSCTAEILISAKSKRVAAAMRDALLPDLSMLSGKGESAEIFLKGSKIFIRFVSNDTSTVRANVNSALLLAGASFRCLTL